MSVTEKLTFIGFGEAGSAFAEGLSLPPGIGACYDIKLDSQSDASAIRSACARTGVAAAPGPAVALVDTTLIFCLVPTDNTIAAARAAAFHLRPGMTWLDGSSSSPGRKREAASIVEVNGANYIDMAIMAPVHPKLHRTPVLLSGPAAAGILPLLAKLGMVANTAGELVGQASAIKMIRSIMIKGMEAVTAECLLAARRAGVDGAVLASLASSDPDVDWGARTAYNLERMTRHGKRRAAELREVVATLEELGLPARVSAATATWEDQLANLNLDLGDEALEGKLDQVLDRLG
ncbi:MAG TPA: DUF1932 domain-containing protein [Devosia sp.]|nr:DUF1932 domain-containing protein [Devosia sp.]